MKLSELTYEYLQSIGLGRVHMHTDCSDALREIHCQFAFDDAKKQLFEKYGDVNLIINPNAEFWSDTIKIDDEKWKADHKKYCDDKADWCSKHGCE